MRTPIYQPVWSYWSAIRGLERLIDLPVDHATRAVARAKWLDAKGLVECEACKETSTLGMLTCKACGGQGVREKTNE